MRLLCWYSTVVGVEAPELTMLGPKSMETHVREPEEGMVTWAVSDYRNLHGDWWKVFPGRKELGLKAWPCGNKADSDRPTSPGSVLTTR